MTDPRGNIIRKESPYVSEYYTYDSKGRQTDYEYLNSTGDTIDVRHRYDEEDRLVFFEKKHNGTLEDFFKEIRQNNIVMTETHDSVMIDSTLSNGRHSLTYYEKDGSPANRMSKDGLKLHRIVTQDSPDGIKEIWRYVYSDGEIRPFEHKDYAFHERLKHDAEGTLLYEQGFDPDGKVRYSMMYFYRNGQCIGRAAMGIDGGPVRCPNWEIENFGYYKMYFNRDNSGEYTQLRSVNEADVQSSLFWSTENKYFTVGYPNLKGCKVELNLESGAPLNYAVYIQKPYSQFTAMKAENLASERRFAHLLDRDNPLYRAGLRDGDIIVSPNELRGAKTIETIAFRNGKYSKRTIKLEAPLTPADLRSLHIHPLRITVEEEDYLQDSLKK